MGVSVEENTNQNVEYASFFLRFAAFIIDFTIILLLAAMLGIIGFYSIPPFKNNILLGSLLIFGIYNVYFIGSKYMATPGKRLAGIAVTDNSFNRITYMRAAVRFFSTILSFITLLAGFLMCFFNSKRLCLHDMVAGTVVIKNGEKNEAFYVVLSSNALLFGIFIFLVYALLPFIIFAVLGYYFFWASMSV